MHATLSSPASRTSWFIAVAWLLIAAKCLLVVWAVNHWQAPIHPGWIVWPTISFGLLATGLWIGHRR